MLRPETISAPLTSKAGVPTSNPIVTWDMPVIIDLIQVVFETKPDSGTLDVGTDDTDPDEVIDNFNLTTLSNHAVRSLPPVGSYVPANTRVWAKVSSASSAAGNGGGITIHYHRA